jgi:hypothetical protein
VVSFPGDHVSCGHQNGNKQLTLFTCVDSPNGNKWISTGESDGFFTCSSLSDSLYAFDPLTRKFTKLSPLPRPRYRHSSAIVGGKLWLIGGRTREDSLISEIDVYDIGNGSWSSAFLPAEFQVSDHTCFAQEPSFVYIAGGYSEGYTAMDTLARIDTTSLENDALTIEPQAPLNTARGDVIGVASANGKSAFVSGGFTHANGFCAPLGSSEEYIFATNEWIALPDLVNDRGEVVLVELDDHLYALGGERQLEGFCDGAGDELDPGEMTVGTDEVEVYNHTSDVWEIASGFPNHKFRFAAAAGVDGLIYAFGGQSAHNTECQCFRTTKDVQVFGDPRRSHSSSPSVSVVVTFGALIVAFLF